MANPSDKTSTSDKTCTAKPESSSSKNLKAEVAQMYGAYPGGSKRPEGIHHVAQTNYDTHLAQLQLVEGDKKQGENNLNRSIGDLKSEGKLISNAQAGGTKAIEDIDKGGKNAKDDAIKQLNDILKGLGSNGYNASDKKDFQEALTAAKNGELNKAGADIFNAEGTLKGKATYVKDATGDEQTALKDAKAGKTQDAEAAANKSIKDLHEPTTKKPEESTTKKPESTTQKPAQTQSA